MIQVINCSGGLSSALMTILCYHKGDIVLFTDTGREHPKTYKFLSDFEANEGIPIIRISYPGSFERMIDERGYKYLPNRVARYCTKELKIKTARKYLLSIGITECDNLIGFRFDEKSRVTDYKPRYVKYHSKFPLYERGINNEMVKDFWNKKPYRLEIPHILGNCDLCFMKGSRAIISILVSHPEFADKWIRDEERIGATFIKGISMKQMKSIAKNNLFKDYPLEEIQPEFSCSCGM